MLFSHSAQTQGAQTLKCFQTARDPEVFEDALPALASGSAAYWWEAQSFGPYDVDMKPSALETR